jgi:hypothetical protein
LSPHPASTQHRPAPFETIDVTLTILGDVGEGTLHRYWTPGATFAVGAALPFYLGTIETGAQYAHPEARHGDVPGFRSLFLYAGWSGTHDFGGGVQAGAGLRAGAALLRFDGDTIPESRRSESEPAVAARGGLRWTPLPPWFAEVAITYQSILTSHRIEQVFLSAGLGRRFGTPRWLQDFLD